MIGQVPLRIAAAALALLCLPRPAAAGDWVDTRLVFLIGDDDFMHDAGVTVPPSQRLDIGDRPGYSEFYDQRDDDEAGRETRTHLVLHKAIEGYFSGLTTEAALIIELNHARLLTGDPRALTDDGTYLRFRQRFDAGTFSLTALPFDSDAVRMGWLWDVSWGGARTFPSATVVPALDLGWAGEGYDLGVTVKTARMQFVSADLDARNGQIEAFYGLMGRAGIGDPEGGLRLEVQGAFFEKGRNPNGPVRGERVDAAGVSARLSYIDGLAFHQANELRMYSGNPAVAWNHPGQWGGLRFNAAAELSYLSQILEDPDSTGGTVEDPGLAVATYGAVVFGNSRIGARFIYRDLGFLLFDAPGVVRFQALPDDVDQTPEMVATLEAAHHFPDQHLTPSLTLGIQMPASTSNITPNSGLYPDEILTGRRTAVYRRASMFDDTGLLTGVFLPDDSDALPVYGGRLATQLDLAEGFAVVADVVFLWDDNRVVLEQNVLQVNTVREFDEPFTVGASLMVRAEF